MLANIDSFICRDCTDGW